MSEARRAGLDIVVCGERVTTNQQMAVTIESAATNRCHKFHSPHVQRGSRALPHYQHRDHKLAGHTFYESPPTHCILNREESTS